MEGANSGYPSRNPTPLHGNLLRNAAILALEWFRVKRHSDESRNNTMMLRYFKDCWRSAGKKGYTRDA